MLIMQCLELEVLLGDSLLVLVDRETETKRGKGLGRLSLQAMLVCGKSAEKAKIE